MNPIIRSALAVSILAMPLLTTGCWTSVEVNRRAIISAAAIDAAETTGKVALTLQIVNPGKVRQGGEDAVFIVSEVNDTLFSATRKVQEQLSRKPFWGQVQMVFIGEDIARQGMAPLLDFLDRDFEPNRRTFILIVKGSTGKSILKAGFGFTAIPANERLGIVQLAEGSGRLWISNLNDVLMALESDGKNVATAYLELDPEKETPGEQVDPKQKAIMKGMAAFRKSCLVGYLDDRESRGFSWITNKVKNVAVNVNLDGPEENVGLEVISAKTKLSPEIKNGEVHIKVDVSVEAHVTEVRTTKVKVDLAKLPVVISLNRKLATSIRDEIENSVRKAQALQTDIFGFGEVVSRAYPKLWPTIAKDWDLYVFPKVKVDITTEASILRTGFLFQPVQPK